MKNVVPEEVLKEIFHRRLKRSYLGSEIYDKLKKMILSGKMKKGERLIQEKLALQFNVSRQTIRTAFHQLKKDGLILWKHKDGTFVN